jgi:A/G-specific adenine glycosylase
VLTVDTNIVRIFGRVFEGDLQPIKDTSKDRIKEISEQFIALGRTDLINPALMDFGASICTGRPRCDECPVSDICKAASKFISGQVPEPQRKNKVYAGSDREWRGKILELLTRYSRPVSEKKIRKILSLESDEQTQRLLMGLEKDLLVSRQNQLVKLG